MKDYLTSQYTEHPDDVSQGKEGPEWRVARWYQGLWHRIGWIEPTPEELEKFDELWAKVEGR